MFAGALLPTPEFDEDAEFSAEGMTKVFDAHREDFSALIEAMRNRVRG